MFKRSSLAIAALLLASSQAVGQTEASAPAPAPEKKICRSIVPTGSIMGKRICLTKTEWKEFDGINSKSVDKLQGRPAQPCGALGGPLACGGSN